MSNYHFIYPPPCVPQYLIPLPKNTRTHAHTHTHTQSPCVCVFLNLLCIQNSCSWYDRSQRQMSPYPESLLPRKYHDWLRRQRRPVNVWLADYNDRFVNSGSLNSHYLQHSANRQERRITGHRFQLSFRSTLWLRVAIVMRYWKTWRLLACTVRSYRHLPAARVNSLFCSQISILQPWCDGWIRRLASLSNFPPIAHLVAEHRTSNIDPPRSCIHQVCVTAKHHAAHAHCGAGGGW